jgi:hypothetical protein
MGNYFSLKKYVKSIVSSTIGKFWSYQKRFVKSSSEKGVEIATILNDRRGYDVLTKHVFPLLHGDPKALANLFCVNKYLKEVGDTAPFVTFEGGSLCSMRCYVNTYLYRMVYLWLHFVRMRHLDCAGIMRQLPCIPKYEAMKTTEDMRSAFYRIRDTCAFDGYPIRGVDNITYIAYCQIIPLYGSHTHYGRRLWMVDQKISQNHLDDYDRLSCGTCPMFYQDKIKYIQSNRFKKSLLRTLKREVYSKVVRDIAHQILGDVPYEEIPWFPDFHTAHWYIRVNTSSGISGQKCINHATLLVDADSVASLFEKNERSWWSLLSSFSL